MRTIVALYLEEGNDNNLDIGGTAIEIWALAWYRQLDPHHKTIDAKAVRDYLLHEAHPSLRQVHKPWLDRYWYDERNKFNPIWRGVKRFSYLPLYGVGNRPP